MRRRDAIRTSVEAGTLLLLGAQVAPAPVATAATPLVPPVREQPAVAQDAEGIIGYLDEADSDGLVPLQCDVCESPLYEGDSVCYSCYSGQEDRTSDAHEEIGRLQRSIDTIMSALRSDEFECPFYDGETDKHCGAVLHASVEREYGDFGAVLSSYVKFAGTCSHIEMVNDDHPYSYGLVDRYSERRRMLKKLEHLS